MVDGIESNIDSGDGFAERLAISQGNVYSQNQVVTSLSNKAGNKKRDRIKWFL
jgi:hypothetical protein